MYNDYKAIFIERMQFYETLPFVSEYKEKLAEIMELGKALEQRRSEEAELKEEVKLLQEKKGYLTKQLKSFKCN